MDNLARTDRVKKIAEEPRLSSQHVGRPRHHHRGRRRSGRGCRIAVLKEVRSFSAFTSANDPYGEHDFGFLSVGGHEFFWKIDYYDPSLTRHSDDAADPFVTARVLTIMLTEEY